MDLVSGIYPSISSYCLDVISGGQEPGFIVVRPGALLLTA